MSVKIQSLPEDASRPCLSFWYGDEPIRFERVGRYSSSSRVLIKVHPDCRIQVAAPASASDDEVISAVKKRARWIWGQLRDFRQQLEYVTPRRYVSGESHYYLGKQHMLKIVESSNDIPRVKLLRGRLEVVLRQRDPKAVSQMLDKWYRLRAKEVFIRRLNAMMEQALWVEKLPPLRVQVMQTQWGSCSPLGCITLNPHLVKAPRECIDYVILHELCHLAEHNHSERFYRLMNQVMPGWEKVKTRLDNMASKLLSSAAQAAEDGRS